MSRVIEHVRYSPTIQWGMFIILGSYLNKQIQNTCKAFLLRYHILTFFIGNIIIRNKFLFELKELVRLYFNSK